MTFATRVRNYPIRVPSAFMLNAERALADFQRQILPAVAPEANDTRRFVPLLRAVENLEDYVVTAEVPGVAPADLSVVVEDGVLTLKGVRKSLDWSEDLSDDEKEKASYCFERSVRFNGEIDEGRVTARSKDGLLRIVIPKQSPPVPETTTVSVEVD